MDVVLVLEHERAPSFPAPQQPARTLRQCFGERVGHSCRPGLVNGQHIIEVLLRHAGQASGQHRSPRHQIFHVLRRKGVLGELLVDGTRVHQQPRAALRLDHLSHRHRSPVGDPRVAHRDGSELRSIVTLAVDDQLRIRLVPGQEPLHQRLQPVLLTERACVEHGRVRGLLGAVGGRGVRAHVDKSLHHQVRLLLAVQHRRHLLGENDVPIQQVETPRRRPTCRCVHEADPAVARVLDIGHVGVRGRRRHRSSPSLSHRAGTAGRRSSPRRTPRPRSSAACGLPSSSNARRAPPVPCPEPERAA